MEQTLGMIKPDATERNLIGAVLKMVEDSNLKIKQMRKLKLSRDQANSFYSAHRERPFFNSLIDFMISGEVVVFVVEGEQVIERYREVIGATDPAEARTGTIRKAYGMDKEKNSVHGSDSLENATREIDFFFGTTPGS